MGLLVAAMGPNGSGIWTMRRPMRESALRVHGSSRGELFCAGRKLLHLLRHSGGVSVGVSKKQACLSPQAHLHGQPPVALAWQTELIKKKNKAVLPVRERLRTREEIVP